MSAASEPRASTLKRMRLEASPLAGDPALGAPRGASSVTPAPPPERAVAVSALTVTDVDAFDCPVCFFPLTPPIFQCDVGHVVCSVCADKLMDAGRRECHVCGVAMASGRYRRCHAMERAVGAVRAPCPHAPYGCAAAPAYHARVSHLLACAHAPCRCPAGDACSFAGSADALIDHVAGGGAHGWPCAEEEAGLGWDPDADGFPLELVDGFNFVVAGHDDGGDGRYLFLLDVSSRPPLGHAVSVLCIHPRAAAARCRLAYSRSVHDEDGADEVVTHHQQSEISVACTDLFRGLPDPDRRHQFFLPTFGHGGDDDADAVEVKVWLSFD